MRHVTAFVLEQNERAVLQTLGRLGTVHLTRSTADATDVPVTACDHSGELARCGRVLNRLENLAKALDITAPESSAPGKSLKNLDEAEDSLRVLEQRAHELADERQRLAKRREDLIALREKVSDYRELEIPLDESSSSNFLHFITGTLPAHKLGELQRQIGPQAALMALEPRDGRLPLIAMTTRATRPDLERALQAARFEVEELSLGQGETPAELWRKLEQQEQQAAEDEAAHSSILSALRKEAAGQFTSIARLVNREKALFEASNNFSATGSTILFTGWIPAIEAPRLERALQESTNDRCLIEIVEPQKSPTPEVPVLLNHRRWLRPFEMLVSAYGMPKYEEVEPTLFVAISYLLMFGMMFGDVGHGLVLALGGWFALAFGKKMKLRDAGLLLLYGGLSSMAFGWLYGSVFGLARFKKYAFWHDPLEAQPLQLMYGALGIGVAVISVGLLLNIINRFRRGDLAGGVFDKFGVAGLFFYWGALFLILNFDSLQSHRLAVPGLLLFVALPFMVWVAQQILHETHNLKSGRARPEGSLISTITESFTEAFEAMLSYLANTISFVRLAAYAMSHAALLLAAFSMAAEVKHLAFGGSGLSILVLIAGNAISIALEGIIASVQALRLEYYEFFSKFFSGTGQVFTPFRLPGDLEFPEPIRITETAALSK